MIKRQYRTVKNRFLLMKAAAFLAVFILIINLTGMPAKAEYVTDTLTVKVGYGGMDLSEYVEIGTYHWSELYETLPIYEVPYSYFQNESDTQYNAIVDSGRGFYITDLLDWLNIYYGDIYNLQFYVNDHHGIQAAFDRDSLFTERYYFNDLPGHREILRDELTWNITGYDFSDAWSDCYQVEPMLAIEDNWASFTQETEHIAPDFEQANPGNRFRLLFGQTEPTEQLTSKSAKYVSCIYVTLYGEPVYGDPPELDGTLGSHEVEMTVSVDNLNIRKALSELMNITSSDESVLVINGINIVLDDTYSDLAHVIISYEVVGKGSATINAGIGSIEPPEAPIIPMDNTNIPDEEETPEETDPPEEQDPPEEEDPGNVVPEGGDENTPGNDDLPEDTENEDVGTLPEDSEEEAAVPDENEPENYTEPENSYEQTAEAAPVSDNQSRPDNNEAGPVQPRPQPEKPAENKTEKTDTPADQEITAAVEETAALPAAPVVFKVADSVFRNPDLDAEQTQVAAVEDITQIKAEDRSEEKKALEKKVMIGVLIGCLFFMASGSFFEGLYFRRRLRGGKYVLSINAK